MGAPTLADARKAIARARGVSASSFEVELVGDTGPGVRLITARGEGREGIYDAVVAIDGRLILDRNDARMRTLAAWDYRIDHRTVTPTQFARVMGALYGHSTNCAAVLTPFDIESRGRWKEVLFLPRETERGVEFWATPGGDMMLHLYSFDLTGAEMTVKLREVGQ